MRVNVDFPNERLSKIVNDLERDVFRAKKRLDRAYKPIDVVKAIREYSHAVGCYNDYVRKIEEDPEKFVRNLLQYLHSGQ